MIQEHLGAICQRDSDSNPVLHDMPKFVTTCTGIRIGNGSIVPALFVIPILFMTCGQTFEIFTIVAEIDDDMDLVFGFKNMVETERMLNTRTGGYDLLVGLFLYSHKMIWMSQQERKLILK